MRTFRVSLFIDAAHGVETFAVTVQAASAAAAFDQAVADLQADEATSSGYTIHPEEWDNATEIDCFEIAAPLITAPLSFDQDDPKGYTDIRVALFDDPADDSGDSDLFGRFSFDNREGTGYLSLTAGEAALGDLTLPVEHIPALRKMLTAAVNASARAVTPDTPLADWQVKAMASYAEGDYADCATLADTKHVGDTIVAGIMLELDAAEGCDSETEALRRLNNVADDVRRMIEALTA